MPAPGRSTRTVMRTRRRKIDRHGADRAWLGRRQRSSLSRGGLTAAHQCHKCRHGVLDGILHESAHESCGKEIKSEEEYGDAVSPALAQGRQSFTHQFNYAWNNLAIPCSRAGLRVADMLACINDGVRDKIGAQLQCPPPREECRQN
jgi:hypothetical protein